MKMGTKEHKQFKDEEICTCPCKIALGKRHKKNKRNIFLDSCSWAILRRNLPKKELELWP